MTKIKEPVPARAAAYCAIYPMLLQIAKDHGYSLAVHGSLHRDLDLVAIPWIEEASDALILISAIKDATATVVHHELRDHLFTDLHPTEKPHGRMAYSLHVTNDGMYGGYLDISIMPRRILNERNTKTSAGEAQRSEGSEEAGARRSDEGTTGEN